MNIIRQSNPVSARLLSLMAMFTILALSTACSFTDDEPTPTAVSVAPTEVIQVDVSAIEDDDNADTSLESSESTEDVADEVETESETVAATTEGGISSPSLTTDDDEQPIGLSSAPRLPFDEVPPLPDTTDLPDAVPEDIGTIWEAFQIINDEYVDHSLIDPDKMSESAIRAFIEALGDPHMTYISPEQMQLSRADLAGSFEGIGASVNVAPDGKGVIIVAPFDGYPAKEAGIRAGDRILAVDGEDASEWTVTDAVLKIRGEGGTPVTLTVLHVGETDPVDITIIRGRVELESVTSRMIPDTAYGELHIEQFTDETPREIREHMNDLMSKGAEGVVIDLRGNPGGLLNATLDSASEFISEGRLAYEQDRNGARRDFYAHGNGNFVNVPAVVLVNNWSGSGAELFAGAMQDHGRAVLIGVQTFGKGSVNITHRLSNGAGLNITIRRWYTPDGNIIEGVGLTPDVEVEYPENVDQRDVDFEDPQLGAAIRQLDFQTRVTTLSK